MPISVVINTYNAETHLARVLESVKNFDEILICDMESTDSTLKIASQYGCRIITFPKGDITIVEPARQFAIDAATYPWILVVDSDELVTPSLRDFLYKTIDRNNAPAGIAIPRKNYFMGRFMHCHYPDYLLRFFRKEGTVWPAIIHISPIVKGKIERIPSNEEDKAFIHLANDSIYSIIKKTNDYTDNELNKKKATLGVGSLLWRPLFRFFKAYIIKGGFRDGAPGFIRSVNEGIYQFILVSKIIEKRINSKRQ